MSNDLPSVGTENAIVRHYTDQVMQVVNDVPMDAARTQWGVDACEMLRDLVAERDELASRVRELEGDAKRWGGEQVARLTAERDALAGRVRELEGALRYAQRLLNGNAPQCALEAIEAALLAPQAEPAAVEMSPEFTDTARAALLWVLWHHQGASSKVGQPIRFALGMGQHERLNEHQVSEAKRWQALAATPSALTGKDSLAVEPDERVECELLAAFDDAVATELPCVSTVQYNSHEICKWFAKNVRDRLAARASKGTK